MDREEYIRLQRKIRERFDGRRVELEKQIRSLAEERLVSIASLNRVWEIDNGQEPPPTGEIAEPSTPSNGDHPNSSGLKLPTRNDKIRYAVKFVEGNDVTQALVKAKFQELFPEAAEGIQATHIAKVLRGMEKIGELKRVRQASGHGPLTYRKAGTLLS